MLDVLPTAYRPCARLGTELPSHQARTAGALAQRRGGVGEYERAPVICKNIGLNAFGTAQMSVMNDAHKLVV